MTVRRRKAGEGRVRDVSQDGEENERAAQKLDPEWTDNERGRGFARQPMEQPPKSGEGGKWQGEDEQQIIMQGGLEMPMGQLVQSAKRTTTGAMQAGGGVKEAAGIKTILRRIEKIEHDNQRGEHGQNNCQPPGESRPGRSDDRRCFHKKSHAPRVRENHPQVKWARTSGLLRTTKAQMPMGSPIRQQGEMQGMMATMLAAMHKPWFSSFFIFRAA